MIAYLLIAAAGIAIVKAKPKAKVLTQTIVNEQATTPDAAPSVATISINVPGWGNTEPAAFTAPIRIVSEPESAGAIY